MFELPDHPQTAATIMARNMAACFGIAAFCLASPLYRHDANEWLVAGLRQLLELRTITA